jgi:mRNA interferase MazF
MEIKNLKIENKTGDYNSWNLVKQNIEKSNNTPHYFPQEGEVWMASVGKNIGFEQNGSGSNFSRPIAVIKKFNNQMFWCVPLSTKQKQFNFYYNFVDPNKQSVSAILAQMKLVSVKRLQRKLYEISPETFKEIKEKLRIFIS